MQSVRQHESQAAEAVTIAWMLACLSTAAGVTVAVVMRLLIAAFPVAAGGVHPLGRVGAVFLFVAFITGCLSLAMTPLAYRLRRCPPPRAITIGAVLIGAAPLVVMMILSLLGG